MFHQLTDKQVSFFGAKLANDKAFGSKYGKTGENMKEFESRVKQELTNPDNQKKWLADLQRVGYTSLTKRIKYSGKKMS